MAFLHALKQRIPERWLRPYHFAMAQIATAFTGNPTERMQVIGVTGTKGKSSTTQMLAQLLMACGEHVAYTSTAGFGINGLEKENRFKMTMPGRGFLMGFLRNAADAGCTYVVVETSSQGILQYRHVGINYDTVVFTNLSPEHIEAHGGYAAYRAAKGELFRHLTARRRKTFDGVRVPKRIVANADDAESQYFLSFAADEKVTYAWGDLTDVRTDGEGLRFRWHGVAFHVPLLARFEQENALAAIATLAAMEFPVSQLAEAARKLHSIPGRFERIDCGQPFTVLVDYAYEPKSIATLLDSIAVMQPKRVIGVHGSAGGGRDKARREAIGRLASEREDIVVITNEDPYDEDPMTIIREVAAGAVQPPMMILDRQEAIDYAVRQAQPGDVVLVCGKGCEPVMAVAKGEKMPWDDRVAARAALAKLGYAT